MAMEEITASARSVAPHRAYEAAQHAQHDREAQRRAGQLQGRADPLPDHHRGRSGELQRFAEIAMQQVAQEDQELHRQRLVEMEALGQRLDLLGRAVDVEEDVDGIAGQPQHDERREGHQQQGERQEGQAAKDVARDHGPANLISEVPHFSCTSVSRSSLSAAAPKPVMSLLTP